MIYSLKVGDTSYSSQAVTDAVEKDKSITMIGAALTQAQMDDILAYAKSKESGRHPTDNSPGHMDAILTAMEQLNPRTLALKISSDGWFGQEALVGKYAAYFSGKADIYNIGLDEYPTGTITWLGLNRKHWPSEGYQKKAMKKFIQICWPATLWKTQNDGIYYNSDTSYGTFDKDIIVSYWTGKNSYDVASSQYELGHRFLAWRCLVLCARQDKSWMQFGNLDQGVSEFPSQHW